LELKQQQVLNGDMLFMQLLSLEDLKNMKFFLLDGPARRSGSEEQHTTIKWKKKRAA
jgi:hypothetical protein